MHLHRHKNNSHLKLQKVSEEKYMIILTIP
jgi:hypothetical protein